MRKICIIVIVFIALFSFRCEVEKKAPSEPQTKLVLLNPNLGYLYSFHHLINAKIIDLPDLQISAVYYNESERKIAEINSYAATINDYILKVKSYTGDLDYNNIFKANSCSEIFYDLFKNNDAIIFLGGADFHPTIYKQKTRLTTEISDHERNLFEMSFLFHLLGGSQNESHKPFLEEKKDYIIYGFCLGMQTMNVATGGSMYQDIPRDIYHLEYVEDVLNLDVNMQHKNYWRNISGDSDLRYNNFHKINLLPGKFFIDNMNLEDGFQPVVRSSHHQAVNVIGKGFEVTATSLDGKVVEGLAHKKYKNVIGVQFHPENHLLYDSEHAGYKYTPRDTVLISDYQILKQYQSLEFHTTFWQYFNNLFKN